MKQFPTLLIFLATLTGMAASFTMTLPLGYSAIANPFNNTSNTADILFPNEDGARDGDILGYYDCDYGRLYFNVQFDSSSPTGFHSPVAGIMPAPVLPPGRGFFYLANNYYGGSTNPATFTGSPPTAVFPSPFSCGCGLYSFLGAQNTNASTYQDFVGAAPVNGSQVLIYVPGHLPTPIDSTNYDSYTYTNGAWSPTNPPLAMGMAAFFYTPCSSTLQFAEDVNWASFNNGQFRSTLTGPSGSNAVISATSDLQTWTPMVTNPLTGGSLNFTDSLATNFLRRFYKAQLQ